MRNDEAGRSVIDKLQQTYTTKNFYMEHSPKIYQTIGTKVTTRGQHMNKVQGDRCSEKSS
jgi:hypothetical protein